MTKREAGFSYTVFETSDDLSEKDAELVSRAREFTKTAYAPYSKFRVAAAARMENGKIVCGTNQENASFPVGICAERVLLSTISSIYPDEQIETIAVTYEPENGISDQPASPCGLCRQTLLEYEQRQEKPIRILLAGMEGEIYLLDTVSHLLPLGFGKENLK